MKYLQNILFIGLAGIIMGGVYFVVSRQGEAVGTSTDSNTDTIATEVPKPSTPKIDLESLEQSVKSIATKYPTLETGFAVITTNQDQTASLEGDIPFMAASTAKVIAAAYAIQQTENGSISFDNTIGAASLKEQIERMIINSDNDAWYAILDEFSYPEITQFGKQNGAASFDAADNIITPLDMSRFMNQLHQGSIISSKNAAYLEDLMKRSDTGTITLAPEFDRLVRKAGWLDDRQNITGLISAGDTTVAYTIFAKSNDGAMFSTFTGNAFINEVLKTITASLQ